MSPTDDPLDPLDAAASALVDGEPVPDGTGVDPASPGVVDRVAAFRRVAVALAGDDPSAVDESRREQSIAAALAAWDAPVRDELADRRAARAPWLRPLGIAAAVVAAVAIGGAALGGLGRDDDDSGDTATAALSLDEEAGGDSAGSSEALPDEAATLGDNPIGDFASLEELVTFVAADDAERSRGAASGTGGDGPTTSVPADDQGATAPPQPTIAASGLVCPPPSGDVVFFVGTARLEGRPVEVYVEVADDGSRQAVVLDAADCSVIDD